MNNIKNFWETCNENFSHIKISGHLKDYKTLTTEWQNNFLSKLESFIKLKDKIVVDYGIGGAYLGLYLNEKYRIQKYIGIDIAERQLEVARKNLVDNKLNHELLMVPQDFSNTKSDCFISQAVIQHFPDLNYLNDFIRNINHSNIPFVVLQIRFDEKTHIRDGNYQSQEEITWKCKTNNEYILQTLTNYENVYKGPILSNKYQFLFYRLK